MQIHVNEYFESFAKLPTIKNTINVNLANALDYINAKEIKSNYSLPMFDNSAMDGFLFDISMQMEDFIDKEISIKNTIFAGDECDDSLEKAQCYKIMTGAKVPHSIKKPSVIPIEYALNENKKSVTFSKNILKDAWSGSNHIRFKGENLKENEVILKKNARINFSAIALLASQGIENLQVYERLKIAIFSSGNELDDANKMSKIYDINSKSIFNALKHYGFESSIYPTLKDDILEYKKHIVSALEKNDVVIVSGGASVGERDYAKEFLKEINGDILCQKLFLKPGKPMIVANVGQKIFINLPGNPQSCLMNLVVLIVPLLKYIQNENYNFTKIRATNKNAIKLNTGITSNILGNYENGIFSAYNKGIINSSDIASFYKCNAILSYEGKNKNNVEKNEIIDIILY